MTPRIRATRKNACDQLLNVSIFIMGEFNSGKKAGLSRLSDTYRCRVPISLLCRAKATCTSSRLGLWILMESNHLYSVLCLTHKVRMTYSSICYSEPLCNIRLPSFRAANMFFLSSLNKVFSLQHINVIHLTCGEAPT